MTADPRCIQVEGVELAVWERAGSDPAVLFCHATGFHARCWDYIVELLPAVRVVAIDMRGHGRSTKPAPPIPWKQFGRDVAAVARELGVRDLIGVGHSMGGHSLVVAAAQYPEAFGELILLDPVILPRGAYIGPYEEPHYARKRRNRWSSPQAMIERFRERAPFDKWNARVLNDYCEYGLLPDGDEFVLACPPEIEGAIYEQSRARESDPSQEIADLAIPVEVVRANAKTTDDPGRDMTASPTDPALASRFTQGRELLVPFTHFIPMEAPEFVAERIAEAIRRRRSA